MTARRMRANWMEHAADHFHHWGTGLIAFGGDKGG